MEPFGKMKENLLPDTNVASLTFECSCSLFVVSEPGAPCPSCCPHLQGQAQDGGQGHRSSGLRGQSSAGRRCLGKAERKEAGILQGRSPCAVCEVVTCEGQLPASWAAPTSQASSSKLRLRVGFLVETGNAHSQGDGSPRDLTGMGVGTEATGKWAGPWGSPQMLAGAPEHQDWSNSGCRRGKAARMSHLRSARVFPLIQ